MVDLKDEMILLWLVVLAAAYLAHVYWQRQRGILMLGDAENSPSHLATDEAFPYQKKLYLLSLAERAIYDLLRQAAGSRFQVFAKVRLLDLLWIPENIKGRERYIGRVMSNRVDFALCHATSLAPAMVIELVDDSEELRGEHGRETFVDQVLKTAGIPILRLPLGNQYRHHELSRCLEEALNRPGLITRADGRPVAYLCPHGDPDPLRTFRS